MKKNKCSVHIVRNPVCPVCARLIREENYFKNKKVKGKKSGTYTRD